MLRLSSWRRAVFMSARSRVGPGRVQRMRCQAVTWWFGGALGGTRTPNLLIRSQMLYPLSYERLMPG